jgi:RimJ/RimL family protein N-acetyltransferase
MPDPLPGETFHVLTADNLSGLQTVVERLLSVSPDNAEYVTDIRRRRVIGFIIEFDSTVVHYGYVFLRNKTACILGLDSKTALIGNAFTVPAYRGKSAQPRSVKARASLARAGGYERILAETSLDNLASQRGMTKGGMQLLGRMDLLLAISILVFRWRRPAGFPIFGFCLRAN